MDVGADFDPSVYGEHASSSMDVDADFDPSVYGTTEKSSPPVTTHKSADNKTAGASSSSSMDVDVPSDPSVYGTKDVPTPNMSVNETTMESAPDGQKRILIEEEIDSVASHGESTPRLVTQTQVPIYVGEDTIVVPNPASNLIQREYISRYVKDYPTIKGAQYWSDEIPDPAFPVLQETNFKPP
jgi:hypothetical protein